MPRVLKKGLMAVHVVNPEKKPTCGEFRIDQREGLIGQLFGFDASNITLASHSFPIPETLMPDLPPDDEEEF